MAINCFRYLDFTSFDQLDDLLLQEYNLLMKAFRLKRLDREREIHLQAWVNNQVKATKKSGRDVKPYFKDFQKFFDYEKKQKEILVPTVSNKKKKEYDRLKRIAEWANKQ